MPEEIGVEVVEWKSEAEKRLAILERVYQALPVPQNVYEKWLVGRMIQLIDQEKAAIAVLSEAGVAFAGRLAS